MPLSDVAGGSLFCEDATRGVGDDCTGFTGEKEESGTGRRTASGGGDIEGAIVGMIDASSEDGGVEGGFNERQHFTMCSRSCLKEH
jgi:hypothetical protein